MSLLSLLIVEMGRLPYPSQALGLGANPIRAQPSYGCATTADSLEALAWLCFCRPPPRCRNAPCSPSRSPTPVFSFASAMIKQLIVNHAVRRVVSVVIYAGLIGLAMTIA